MRELVDAVHRRAAEGAHAAAWRDAGWEEAAFCMRLASTAMFGDVILGPMLNASCGVDEAFQKRFRHWLDDS